MILKYFSINKCRQINLIFGHVSGWGSLISIAALFFDFAVFFFCPHRYELAVISCLWSKNGVFADFHPKEYLDLFRYRNVCRSVEFSEGSPEFYCVFVHISTLERNLTCLINLSRVRKTAPI